MNIIDEIETQKNNSNNKNPEQTKAEKKMRTEAIVKRLELMIFLCI